MSAARLERRWRSGPSELNPTTIKLTLAVSGGHGKRENSYPLVLVPLQRENFTPASKYASAISDLKSKTPHML
jgi:hypothetical protein